MNCLVAELALTISDEVVTTDTGWVKVFTKLSIKLIIYEALTLYPDLYNILPNQKNQVRNLFCKPQIEMSGFSQIEMSS